MPSHSSDVIAQFVSCARVRHTCTALATMVVGEEQDVSVLEGDLETGLFWTVDTLGNSHALAWGEAGLVALVLEVSSEMVELRPESCLEDSPPQLRDLVSRVLSHQYVNEVATAGFWLTTDAPSLDRLSDERLRLLRCYASPPEAITWDSETTGLSLLPKEFALFALEAEKASRFGLYEVSAEQGERLLPHHWFRERAKPAAKVGRLYGDSITLENVDLAVAKLAEVGIAWNSATEIAKARGIERRGEDSGTGNDWTSTLNIAKRDASDDE